MKVLRGFKDGPAFARATAVAIGNFDGVHLGHQRILSCLVETAGAGGLISLVLTFSPHPERVLEGRPIAMIQTLSQRLDRIRACGVRAVLVASFDPGFADLSPAEFVDRIIVSHLRAKEVVVGENFRFGRSRQGDIDDLRQYGKVRGFGVRRIPAVVRHGQVVSSSLIRRLLEEGKVGRARVLLGRPYEIEGRVVRGAGRGRALGFPTANLRTCNEILPGGVFLTVAASGGRTYPSITNIGHRPTFGGGRLEVESHIFDQRSPLYGRPLCLRFLRKIRTEKEYPDSARLVAQVRKDMAAARDYFERRKRFLP
jgi:riboflavin kinase / FMN adenylyltransferase